MQQPSPYTPGQVASDVPGRAEQLAEIQERLDYLTGLHRLVGRIRVDIGPRGLGKTSLLRAAQRAAEARGAATVWVTAGERSGLIAAIAAQVMELSATWTANRRTALLDALGALTITTKMSVPGIVSVSATHTPEEGTSRPADAGTRAFQRMIVDATALAGEEGRSGLVLFIDEIQAADEDGIRSLAYAWQHLQSEGADVPVAVFAAGLSITPDVIAAAVTFSERFAYRRLAGLTEDAAALALVDPARALGIEWDDDALRSAVEAAAGFPYSVQLIGDATWTAAGYPPAGDVLRLAQVEIGKARALEDLDSLFRSRWQQATPAEQDFLAAMARLEAAGPITRRAVVDALGGSDVSVVRSRLIDKGMIDAPSYGNLGFTVPGFAHWIRSR